MPCLAFGGHEMEKRTSGFMGSKGKVGEGRSMCGLTALHVLFSLCGKRVPIIKK